MSSELGNSGIRVAVGDCSFTERRRWRPPYQTVKTAHVNAKHYNHNEDGRTDGRTAPGWGWSGGAMVLGKLPVPGRPTIWITVGQGPTSLAVGAGGGCLDIFTLIYPFFPLSPSLWETARYRLKYCLKGPLNTKQPTNQPTAPGVCGNGFVPLSHLGNVVTRNGIHTHEEIGNLHLT